jgi:hypothetical protein
MAGVSKTVESGVRNPRSGGIEFMPDRRYLKVQRDVPSLQYESPLEKFLDMPSPSNPGELMYRQESEDSRVTGSRQMVTISCSVEDFKAMEKVYAEEARQREAVLSKKKGPHGDIAEEEESFVRSKHAIMSD